VASRDSSLHRAQARESDPGCGTARTGEALRGGLA
jgi:hypothetical protein